MTRPQKKSKKKLAKAPAKKSAKKTSSKSSPSRGPAPKPLPKPTLAPPPPPEPAPSPGSRPTAPTRPATNLLAVPPTPVLPTRVIDEDQQRLFTELGSQVMLLKVIDEESSRQAGEMLVQLKHWTERLDEERLLRTRPLKEQAKRIEALFRPYTEKLESWTKELKQRSLQFHALQQEAVKQEQKKLLAEATSAQEAGDLNKAAALATKSAEMGIVTNTTLLGGGQTQVRHPWTFEVEDLGKVPAEYKSLDEKKVTAAIRAGLRDMDENGTPVEDRDGPRSRFAIPGIRIFRGTQLAVSASGELPRSA